MKQQVLILCHGYNPPFVDVCNQYAMIFDPTKYETTIAYLTGKPDEVIRSKTQADHVLFIQQAKKSVRGLKIGAIKQLLDLHRRKNFSIVICHRFKPFYIMALVRLFKAIPHFFCVMHELHTLQRWSRQLFIYIFARKQVVFAGVSSAVRDDMKQSMQWLREDQFVVLPNVLDIAQTEKQLLSKEQARHALHLTADDIVLGNIGRLVVNKDQATLIKAFHLIYQQHPKAKLIIIGQGALEDPLKQLIHELNLTGKVMMAGFVADAFRYVKAFDIYVSSSLQEAFGRVLLEAMVGHVPIVATRVNGVGEVVGDAGLLVPACDPMALSQAMDTMLTCSPQTMTDWQTKSYQRVQSHFSKECFAKTFFKLLD